MKNLEEINFTAEDFELMQKALGCVCLAEEKNSTSIIDAILESMPPHYSQSRSYGGPDFFESLKKDATLRQKAEQKEKRDAFNERKITLQYKLIQFKKLLSSKASEPLGEPRYTAKEWQDIMAGAMEVEGEYPQFNSTEPQKKSHESAFSEES